MPRTGRQPFSWAIDIKTAEKMSKLHRDHKLSYATIARRFGVSSTAVARAVHRWETSNGEVA